MNIADITLETAIRAGSKPADQGSREDLFKVILMGAVIKGDINYTDPKPDMWRCWSLAKTAAEVMEQT